MQQTAAIRILDAAANRAAEGLRVVEDYLRLALDDRHLTSLAKQLRHDLAEAVARIPAAERHAARDTRRDVGTDLSTASESNRSDLAAVAAAAFKRVQQALRSLEEFSKLVEPRFATVFESLRYRSYTLEKAVDLTAESLRRLGETRLYILIDGGRPADDFATVVRSLVAAGAGAIQLRDKHLADRQLLARARQLREITAGSATLFIMNDRPDLATLSQADGIHIGQDELTVKDVRTIVGPRMLIGVSTHSREQARQAVLDGANYIGVGPTFPSSTKSFERFPGLELLRAVATEIRLPAFAIGGIGIENLSEVLATGIRRVAIGSSVASATDPAAAADAIRKFLADQCAIDV
jgi:thiamine-phosphate pyrophosphorylase